MLVGRSDALFSHLLLDAWLRAGVFIHRNLETIEQAFAVGRGVDVLRIDRGGVEFAVYYATSRNVRNLVHDSRDAGVYAIEWNGNRRARARLLGHLRTSAW